MVRRRLWWAVLLLDCLRLRAGRGGGPAGGPAAGGTAAGAPGRSHRRVAGRPARQAAQRIGGAGRRVGGASPAAWSSPGASGTSSSRCCPTPASRWSCRCCARRTTRPRPASSLPPYVAEGTTDSDLALHLARYGDDEAARKLVDPADAEARRRIEASGYGRNYPVEWARLAGLMLHVAQMRLAQGEPEAATELVVLHRQLGEALDAKAAAGPLGAVLLPPGRQALTQAAAAWRGSKRTALLAEDIEAALARLGRGAGAGAGRRAGGRPRRRGPVAAQSGAGSRHPGPGDQPRPGPARPAAAARGGAGGPGPVRSRRPAARNPGDLPPRRRHPLPDAARPGDCAGASGRERHRREGSRPADAQLRGRRLHL